MSEEKNDSNTQETNNTQVSVQILEAESAQTETQPSGEEVTESEKHTEHLENAKDLDKVPVDPSASLLKLDLNASIDPPSVKDLDLESETDVVPDITEGEKVESALEIMSEKSATGDGPASSEVEALPEGDIFNKQASVSMGEPNPELKTSLGATFDAVVTGEETTTKVTPQVEGVEEEADHKDVITERKEEIPLLPFSEGTPEAPAIDSLVNQESPPTAQDDKLNATEDGNLWTKVFSVVTGTEATTEDVSSDEEDDDEDEKIEDAEAGAQPSLGKTEEEPLLADSQNATENINVPEDASHSTTVEQDIKETNSDDEKPLLDGEHESVEDVIRQKEAYETLKPTDEIDQEIDKSIKSVPDEDDVGLPQDDIKTLETIEDIKEESKDSEITRDRGDIEDSIVVTEQDFEMFEENKHAIDQEVASATTEKAQDLSTEQKQSNDSDVQVVEHVEDEKLPDQIPENVAIEAESNGSQTGSPVEEAEIHEPPQTEEEEDTKDAETEDHNEPQEEELLEDENALFVSRPDDLHTEEPSPEAPHPTESDPEPEYSDNIVRLTVLREHFTEENMERVQKLLGLKNLYKIEAMFSDLDTELQATRVSHTGSTQDIENALESILETSENSILDEIEKMLDGQEAKQEDIIHADTGSLDEEAEVLDDFQELAFSLRQKYSTVSDSTPLAETPLDIMEGWFDFPFLNLVILWKLGLLQNFCRV